MGVVMVSISFFFLFFFFVFLFFFLSFLPSLYTTKSISLYRLDV